MTCVLVGSYRIGIGLEEGLVFEGGGNFLRGEGPLEAPARRVVPESPVDG